MLIPVMDNIYTFIIYFLTYWIVELNKYCQSHPCNARRAVPLGLRLFLPESCRDRHALGGQLQTKNLPQFHGHLVQGLVAYLRLQASMAVRLRILYPLSYSFPPNKESFLRGTARSLPVNIGCTVSRKFFDLLSVIYD